MHIRKIIHRDIRPENFKINMKGYLYLVDYSNAKSFNSEDNLNHIRNNDYFKNSSNNNRVISSSNDSSDKSINN